MSTDVSKDHAPFRLVMGLKVGEEGRRTVVEAARISGRIPGCVLHVLHVVPATLGAPGLQEQTASLRTFLDESLAPLGAPPGVTIAIDIREGEPVREITSFAREIDADLVMLGSDKGHRPPWDCAPTAERVGDAITCPVLMNVSAR